MPGDPDGRPAEPVQHGDHRDHRDPGDRGRVTPPEWWRRRHDERPLNEPDTGR
jgi:hypothetical protein